MSSGFKRCILFDWGGTLMREFPEYEGKMVEWPQVEAMPGAANALKILRSGWLLAVATNAAASEEADIWGALRRVDLGQYLDAVFCYRKIGFRKPFPEFFRYILGELKVEPDQVIMVGDDFEVDILGANRSGIRGIWYNPLTDQDREGELYRTIHDMDRLTAAVNQFYSPPAG